MAEEMLLPLIGFNMGDGGADSSDSDFDIHEYDDPDADGDLTDSDSDSDDENVDNMLRLRKKKKEKKQAPNVTFDRCLPGAHSYLGSDLEDVRGRTVHDEETTLRLPIHSHPGVILFPGQVLPLQLFQPAVVAMMRKLVDGGDKTFGMVTSSYDRGSYVPKMASVGTTAEISSFKEETDEPSGITTVRIKAIGRQRFAIKSTDRQIDGNLIGNVRILPECILPDPLEGAVPPSHLRLIGSQEVAKPDTQPTHKPTHTKRLCISQVKRELSSWNDSLREESMPSDPREFSFWVAGNLPIDDSLKLHLLGMDSAVQRLRCELSIMKKCNMLHCKECGELITTKSDVFSMAVEGPMGAYVNPGGHVHETLTVYKAQNLQLVGQPSTEHSWFPGYAWTIVVCRACNRHIGWKFTARNLQPDKFWGLSRSSLIPRIDDGGEEGRRWLPSQ